MLEVSIRVFIERLQYMIKICELCDNQFETSSSTRIYCYDCSGDSNRRDNMYVSIRIYIERL